MIYTFAPHLVIKYMLSKKKKKKIANPKDASIFLLFYLQVFTDSDCTDDENTDLLFPKGV
jgi:hypothetical protein